MDSHAKYWKFESPGVAFQDTKSPYSWARVAACIDDARIKSEIRFDIEPRARSSSGKDVYPGLS